jgi:hypothetical protein
VIGVCVSAREVQGKASEELLVVIGNKRASARSSGQRYGFTDWSRFPCQPAA